jgi:hypothetical protein
MIGLFGHEFCHFTDYSNRNIFGILSRLMAYSNRESKEKFEKEINLMTMKRGLAWQLYDWSYYIQHDSDSSEKYKEYKRYIYLEPEEIKAYIDNC